MTRRVRPHTGYRRGPVLLVALVAVLAGSVSVVHGQVQNIQVAPGQEGRLRADRVRYDLRTQVLTAEGNVVLLLGSLELRAARLRLEQKALLAFADGGVVVSQPGSVLRAESLRYDIRRRTAQAEGGVVLTQEGVTIRAPRLAFDVERQTVAAAGGVAATQGRNVVRGQGLQADLKAKRGEVTGDVQLTLPGPAPSGGVGGGPAPPEIVIGAARLRFRWDGVEAEAEGGVTLRQGEVGARAARLHYAEATGRLDLEGAVVVEQFADAATAHGATLSADRLTLILAAGDMEASGKVTVTQKGRTATGDRGTYTGKSQQVVLVGRVQIQDEEGNLIRADRVVIALAEEAFEASGNVETTFRVKRGK